MRVEHSLASSAWSLWSAKIHNTYIYKEFKELKWCRLLTFKPNLLWTVSAISLCASKHCAFTMKSQRPLVVVVIMTRATEQGGWISALINSFTKSRMIQLHKNNTICEAFPTFFFCHLDHRPTQVGRLKICRLHDHDLTLKLQCAA